ERKFFMKDHQNNMPPQGNQPPAPPPAKHRKREKRRRRGPSFGFIFLLIIIIGIGAVVALWKNGFIHFGKDDGSGSGDGSGNAIVSSVPTDSETSVGSTVVEIKVDEEKIYFDGTEVANAEELKDKITEIADKKTYNFVHDSAIKATYDEVKAVLTDLEKALNIKVNYNDTNE
ncbi:MAG: hypothetical protein K2J80_14495, partial [Oscillospiraceae bacterium]|nr:hypothetical protein [Oscillospiraceae bacterium]